MTKPLIQDMCWHGGFEKTRLEGLRQMLDEGDQALRDRLGAPTGWREAIG